MTRIGQMIEVVKLGDNTWLLKKLSEIEKTLLENPNDTSLGESLRKLLE